MKKMILGLFDDRADVEDAIDSLKARGFNPTDLSIVMKDSAEAENIVNDTGTNVAGGVVSGTATGAILGGLAGLLAATVIPGIGAFLIGGPIAAALGLGGAAATTVSGAATGALAGGLLGAIMSLGLPREDAQVYEQRINEGAILLAVPATSGEEEFVIGIFDDTNASDVKVINQEESSSVREEREESRSHFAQMGAKGGRRTRSRRD